MSANVFFRIQPTKKCTKKTPLHHVPPIDSRNTHSGVTRLTQCQSERAPSGQQSGLSCSAGNVSSPLDAVFRNAAAQKLNCGKTWRCESKCQVTTGQSLRVRSICLRHADEMHLQRRNILGDARRLRACVFFFSRSAADVHRKMVGFGFCEEGGVVQEPEGVWHVEEK